MEEVVPKMACQRGSMRYNPEGGESDPAEGVHRRFKKNSSILSCIGNASKVNSVDGQGTRSKLIQ